MKAIQINQTGSPDVLQYVDVERPAPGKGQVLIKVTAVGVSFADLMLRQGAFYPDMPSLPLIPGSEYSGIVESVGEDVTHLQQGAKVAVLALGQIGGAYAEYAVADMDAVIPFPDDVDLDIVAATLAVYLTAYHLLHTLARAEAGQTILLYGAAGGVGTAVLQLAHLVNITVIGLASSAEKLQYIKGQGAEHAINYNTEDVALRVKEITNGRGVDFILNSVAGDTFSRDFDVLAPFGQLIWFGFAGGPPQLNLTESLGNHFMKSAGIRTFALPSVREFSADLWTQSIEKLIGYIAEEKIKPYIHEKIPLSEAVRAHELMESRSVMGKIILKP